MTTQELEADAHFLFSAELKSPINSFNDEREAPSSTRCPPPSLLQINGVHVKPEEEQEEEQEQEQEEQEQEEQQQEAVVTELHSDVTSLRRGARAAWAINVILAYRFRWRPVQVGGGLYRWVAACTGGWRPVQVGGGLYSTRPLLSISVNTVLPDEHEGSSRSRGHGQNCSGSSASGDSELATAPCFYFEVKALFRPEPPRRVQLDARAAWRAEECPARAGGATSCRWDELRGRASLRTSRFLVPLLPCFLPSACVTAEDKGNCSGVRAAHLRLLPSSGAEGGRCSRPAAGSPVTPPQVSRRFPVNSSTGARWLTPGQLEEPLCSGDRTAGTNPLNTFQPAPVPRCPGAPSGRSMPCETETGSLSGC
ncbi:hypothetical protein EYF80_056644 [Liparis tanakae]|uniref:Uncharacterized protein n=1 Tax=Liparis tanakae TaxID=230148 RepID=A0A4Z2EX84_9TELE|nr:hypothetical protein EYF80_056644 [Liparis tanakae]